MLNKINIAFLVIILVAISTSPALFLEEGSNRNNFLVGVMCLSPLCMLLSFPRINFRNALLVGIMFCVVFFPLLFYPNMMKWSTVLYTTLFCMTFIEYSSLLEKSIFTKEKYFKLCKILIYSYVIVLIAQQICVLAGLPVLNLSAQNYSSESPWKLNSLSSEPSHSVRFVTILMYSYLLLRDSLSPQQQSKDKSSWKIWAAFLWVVLTSISATGILCCGLILLYFVKKRSIIYLLLLIPFLGLALWAFGSSQQLARAYNTTVAVCSLDEATIIQADHSGSARIVPAIICAKKIDLTTLEGWIGRGADYVATFMYSYFPGVEKGYTAGGSFAMALNYGFIPFALFIIFSFSATVDFKYKLSIVFWLIMCNVEGINMQLTWSAILFLYTNKYFLNRASFRKMVVVNTREGKS